MPHHCQSAAQQLLRRCLLRVFGELQRCEYEIVLGKDKTFRWNHLKSDQIGRFTSLRSDDEAGSFVTPTLPGRGKARWKHPPSPELRGIIPLPFLYLQASLIRSSRSHFGTFTATIGIRLTAGCDLNFYSVRAFDGYGGVRTKIQQTNQKTQIIQDDSFKSESLSIGFETTRHCRDCEEQQTEKGKNRQNP